MDDDREVSISIPLDFEGFLRRACPSCDREFKWLPSDSGEPVPRTGYSCPYCRARADTQHWMTAGQVEFAEQTVVSELLGPSLRALERKPDPDALLSISVETSGGDAPRPLTEPDDMSVITFDCHPSEPLKVQLDVQDTFYCLICGSDQGLAATE